MVVDPQPLAREVISFMNSLDIFCFTSVARTRSFSITAKELRISQQAVSKHIKNIEEEIGYALFFRDTGMLELTHAGEYMLEYFSRRSQIVEEIRNRFPLHHKESTLTIACSQWIGCPAFLMDAVRRFHKNVPNTVVHLLDLDMNEVFEAINRGQIDLLVTTRYTARLLPVLWEMLPLTSLPLFLVRCAGTGFQPDKRHMHPFYASLAGEKQENAIHMRVQRTCRSLGFTPNYISVCQDMGSVMLNILLNDGITLGCYALDAKNTADYAFEKTDLSVDLVLCRPFQKKRTLTQQFYSVLMEEITGYFHTYNVRT